MSKINDILHDIQLLQTVESLPVEEVERLKKDLKTASHAKIYLDILALHGKPETALSDYLFKPLMENDDYLSLKISPQIKTGSGWVDYLIHHSVRNPIAIELKPLHKIRVDTIEYNPLEEEFQKLVKDEKNQVKQYLRNHDYVLLTNMKDIYYFNREAIIDFKPFLKENFLLFIEAIRGTTDVWDAVRGKEDTSPKHDLDKKFFFDLKKWYAELSSVNFVPSVNKEEKVVLLLNKFIFLKTLEDYGLIPFNFITETYEDKTRRWITKGRKKVFLEFFTEIDKWTYDYYDTELFRENTFDFIDADDANLQKLQDAIEKILGFSEWAKVFGIGLTHYNYRAINEDIFGKAYETFLAEQRKQQGIFYTHSEITEHMSNRLVDEIFSEYEKRLQTALDCKDFDTAKQIAKQITQIKFIDSTCGSGSFLVKLLKHVWAVYSKINDKTLWATQKGELLEPEEIINHKNSIKDIRDILGIGKENFDGIKAISTIILRHIHGIDLDEKAIDVAKVNLWKEAIKLLPNKFKYSALPADANHILPDLELNFVVANALVDIPIKECIEILQNRYKKEIAELHSIMDSYLHNPYHPELVKNAIPIKEKIRVALHEAFREKGYSIDTKPLFLPLEFFYCYFDADGNPLEDALRGFDGIIGNPPWENIKPIIKEFASRYPDTFGEISKFSVSNKEFENTFRKALKDNSHLNDAWQHYVKEISELSRFIRDNFNLYGSVGDLSYQKVFLEQGINIAKENGAIALLIPSGFHTDEGQKELRQAIISNYTLLDMMSFENRGKKWFPDVDSRFKFDAVVIRKSRNEGNALIKTRFYIHDINELKNPLLLNPTTIEKFSPNVYGFVEFRQQEDIDVSTKIRSNHPLLGDLDFKILSEFHMTNDNELFHANTSKSRLVLFEGKMIHQYENEFDTPSYWINEIDGRNRMLSKELHRIKRHINNSDAEIEFDEEAFAKKKFKLDYEDFRLVYRAVASSTNERSLIATLLPPYVFTGHSLNVFKSFNYGISNDKVKQIHYDYDELMYLLALLNSFTVDYYIRLRVSANLTTYFLYELPIPEINPKLKKDIISMAANLLPSNKDYNDFSKILGCKKENLSPDKKKSLRAKLEKIIAQDVYSLGKQDVEYLLETFVYGNIDADLIEHIKGNLC